MPNFRKKHFIPVALVCLTGLGGLLSLQLMAESEDSATVVPADHSDEAAAREKSTIMRVAAISPQSGGTIRSAILPCTANWHDSAALFAKVSGYLGSQNVDIGSRVKAGDLLATIDVPELDEDVVLAEAALKYQLAAVAQFEARKKSAIAEHRAAEAACVKAQADVERWDAEILFREKEHKRLQALSAASSVQQALVDEKLFQLQSVQAGKHSAETTVLTAREQAAAAGARVELADADLAVARMQTKIEAARLNKARLYASFSKITSPYDGVVISRTYHPGEFIRAADKASGEPLLRVGRTDLIRVVVHIPDRDVPYANAGDPVVIEFDTLSGQIFEGKLARIAHTEDARTRTMRAEVDLPNRENLIVDQMYGRMTIQLHPADKTLTLPSTCLVGELKNGQGSVFVVRDGVARLQSVSIGLHDGIRAEILSGLASQDAVVARPPAGLQDGMAVSVDREVTKS